MGPAQGAHSRPVATPSSSEAPGRAPPSVPWARSERREPAATSGRVSRSDRPGHSRVSANTATRPRASQRPYSLAATTQPPPTAASEATRAKVSAMPASSGRPLLAKGWSARAKTKGSTGRMQGLTMVSTPPR